MGGDCARPECQIPEKSIRRASHAERYVIQYSANAAIPENIRLSGEGRASGRLETCVYILPRMDYSSFVMGHVYLSAESLLSIDCLQRDSQALV